jgi:hypothetical protein
LKNKITKLIGILTITFVLLMPIAAQAADTKSFTFDMVHTLGIGTFTSTKDSVKGTVNMSSWGGDTYFTIYIYEKSGGSNILVDRLGFTKSSAGSPYTDTSYSVKKGNKYGYEIWKNQNKKRIKGSGSLSY